MSATGDQKLPQSVAPSTTAATATPPQKWHSSMAVDDHQRIESSQFQPNMVDSPSIQRQRPDSRLGTTTSVCGDGAETTASCGPLVTYDYHQRAMALHESEMMHPMAGLWYPPPIPPPPMPPMFMCPPPPPNPKEMRKAIKAAMKMEKQRLEMQKKPSACQAYCCDGISQLLCIIIAVIVFGAGVALMCALVMI